MTEPTPQPETAEPTPVADRWRDDERNDGFEVIEPPAWQRESTDDRASGQAARSS
jgi:hypothetical protein